MKETNWQRAKKEFERLKKEGRLDEVDPIPDDVHKSAETIAAKILKNEKDDSR